MQMHRGSTVKRLNLSLIMSFVFACTTVVAASVAGIAMGKARRTVVVSKFTDTSITISPASNRCNEMLVLSTDGTLTVRQCAIQRGYVKKVVLEDNVKVTRK